MSKKKVGDKNRTKADRGIDKAASRTGDAGSKTKTLIMMGASFVALVVVVILIVTIFWNKPVDSSFFHDSDDKVVITMDKETASIEGSAFEPYITHMVYYHDGKNITGLEAYYEYESEDVAKAVYDYLKPNGFADSKYRNGRFVVFKVNKSKYEGVTVDEIKDELERLKQIDAVILDYDENTLGKYGKWYMPAFEEEAAEDADGEDGSDAADDTEGAAVDETPET